MESLDPDVFLTDVVDHPENSRLAIIPTEEEDLEWVSNKDAFPAVETCILPGKEEKEEPNSISVRRERKKKVKLNKSGRKCSHCGTTKTTLWRKGPDGTTSLCNPCGLMYRSGRLCPEYRPQNLPGPANSPTFSPDLYSFRHKSQRLAKRVDKCTTKLVESKKDPLPADEILNTSEQPSSIIIAEQPSPISVLEDSTNSTTTLMSSCGTLKIPHRPRSKGLHKRSAIPWQKVEIGRSCMMADSENKCQNCRSENTTELMLVTLDVGDGTFITKNLCNACHQWFKYGRKKIGRKCQQCGTVETPLWQSDPLVSKTLCNVCQLKCTNSSSSSSSSSMLTKFVSHAKPTHSTPTNLMEEFYSWLKPGDITIGKPLNPVLVLGSSINNSTMTISSFGTSETPRRSRSKGLRRPSGILWQRVEIEKTVNTVNKCHVCNSGSKRNSLGSETLCNACYQVSRHFSNQTNNNPNKEISVEMEIGRKCQHCGIEKTSLWRQGPLGPKTLCNACGLRWYKFRDLCPEYRPANSPTFSRKLHSNRHKELTELRKPNILSRDDGVAC